MTRETKIGLLVGLAFIIVIGILLSDHFTSTTAPLAAPVAGTAGTVRESVRAPGEGMVTRPKIDTSLATQPDVPLVLEAPRRSQAHVEVQPPVFAAPERGNYAERGSYGAPGYGGGVAEVSPRSPMDQQGVIVPGVIPAEPLVSQTPEVSSEQPSWPFETPRGNVVKPEELVPDNTVAQNQNPNQSSNQSPNPNRGEARPENGGGPGMVAVKVYKVQDGDTISKIARKTFGTDSKAAIDAIAKVNPGMRDVHKITAGKPLNLPVSLPSEKKEVAAAAGTGGATGGVTSSGEVIVPIGGVAVGGAAGGTTTVTASDVQSGREYTTKPGDTLWRIAVDQCGSPSLVKELKALNRDVLKGGETIRPNMKLRLPAKAVAAAE